MLQTHFSRAASDQLAAEVFGQAVSGVYGCRFRLCGFGSLGLLSHACCLIVNLAPALMIVHGHLHWMIVNWHLHWMIVKGLLLWMIVNWHWMIVNWLCALDDCQGSCSR